MTSSIGSRIKLLRERQSRTQDELADFMSWGSHTIVSNVESGSREIKARELAKIADFFKVSLDTFFEPSEQIPTKFFWRNRPGTYTKFESEFRSMANEFTNLELLSGLQSKFRKLPYFEFDPKNFRKDDSEISNLASSVRGQMELGKFPSNGLIQVLEDIYGVKFFTFSSNGSQGSAATLLDEILGPCIFLNSQEKSWRQNFSIAHELFHLLTWPSMNFDELFNDTNLFERNERAADAFAAALLLPEEVVRTEVERLRTEKGKLLVSDVVYLSLQFGVSAHALMLRLKNLGISNPDKIEKALDSYEFSKLVRKSNQDRVAGHDIGKRFLRIAVSCHLKGRLSKSRLAKMLNMSLLELDEYLAIELADDFEELIEDEITNS